MPELAINSTTLPAEHVVGGRRFRYKETRNGVVAVTPWSNYATVGPSVAGTWTLAWSDEFTTLDLTTADSGAQAATYEGKWRANDDWQHAGRGWVDYAGTNWNLNPNESLGGAPRSPFKVANSVLTIEAFPTPDAWKADIETSMANQGIVSPVAPTWCGGFLQTNDLLAGQKFKYGLYEFRMRLPTPGKGMFPALWLYATDGSTDPLDKGRAEIDLFEVFGSSTGRPWHVHTHYESNNGTVVRPEVALGPFDDDTAGWHTYALDWQSTHLRFYKDGVLRAELTGEDASWFNTTMNLRLNFAMNPNWDATLHADATTPSLMTMDVDFVRVWTSSGGGSTPEPTPLTTLWTAGHETGNLTEWGVNDTNGGIYTSGSASSTASTERARTGTWSAKTQWNGPSESGTRLFRWGELHTNRAVYAETWHYFPAAVTVGSWWNIMQLKSTNTDRSWNDPIWEVAVTNPSAGVMRAHIHWRSSHNTLGPQSGQGPASVNYHQTGTPVNIPVGQWVRFRMYIRQSNQFDGRIAVWQDDTLLFDMDNVRTGYVNTAVGNAWNVDNGWSAINYGASLSPAPVVMYVDDAAISTGAAPGTGGGGGGGGGTSSTTITATGSVANDDRGWQPGVYVDTFNSVTLIGSDTSAAAWHVFARVTNVQIPKGATVSGATLRFTGGDVPWGTGNGSAALEVAAVAADNAAAPSSLTAADGLLSSLTTARTAWSIPASGFAAGTTIASPGIAAVVQEIVNRPGWAAGNSIVFVLRDTQTGTVNASLPVRKANDAAVSNRPTLSATFS